jgi:DNA-binding response OmpR family regulator
MHPDRREHIRRSLTSLVASYTATLDVMNQTLALLYEELSLDLLTYFRTCSSPPGGCPDLEVDRSQLLVRFRGRTCFLGNGLPLRFLARLAQRPGHYFEYEELLTDVWGGDRRSDASVRSVVKLLRRKLRAAGMGDLADAIDGSQAGRYALKVRP